MAVDDEESPIRCINNVEFGQADITAIYNLIRDFPDTYMVFPFELLNIFTTFASSNNHKTQFL